MRWALSALFFVALFGAAQAQRADTLRTGVRFLVRDSLVVRVDSHAIRLELFGGVRLRYEEVVLEAPAVSLESGSALLEARAQGAELPRLVQAAEVLTGQEIAYNYRTRRGRIVGAQGRLEQGSLRAEVAKRVEPRVLFIQGARFSTCELNRPHFFLRAGRMKLIEQQEVLAQNVQLHVLNLPTPLWLPFAYFPLETRRRSGLLLPTYGQSPVLGFFLRDGGYYWGISDHLDLTLRGDVWTRGSWGLRAELRYALRYRFQGALELGYLRQVLGEPEDPAYQRRTEAHLRWAHAQELDPWTRLSANVYLASGTYFRRLSRDLADLWRRDIRNTIALTRSAPQSPWSLSLDASQTLDLATGVMQLQAPTLRISRRTFAPFRHGSEGRRWYEAINVSYTLELQNRFAFRPNPAYPEVSWFDALRSARLYRLAMGAEEERFRAGALHQVPVYASFPVLRYITISPALNYTEAWYLQTLRLRWNPERGRVDTLRVRGFRALRTLDVGAGLVTRLFGIFPWRLGSLEGFRHVLEPSLSLRWTPDYRAPLWGYFRRVQVDAQGRTALYSPFEGALYGAPPQRGGGVLSMGLNNRLETRRAIPDTLGNGRRYEVIRIVESLSLLSGYRIGVDSLAWSPLVLAARTTLWSGTSLDGTITWSPYALDARGRVRNQWAFRAGQGLLRLDSWGFSLSAALRPELLGIRVRSDSAAALLERPWNVALNAYVRFQYPEPGRRIWSSALSASFSVSLTPGWRLSGITGYDLVQARMTTTSIALYRDLHCWELSLQVIPFGERQSYFFELRVKSPLLRDLRFVRRQDWLDRF
ncbi:MAG: putative LPS assembly protein LptD [Bacteroidetes bacterium]|nr:putative LPS assembly protein LptD [Bacteroidota bacterium]